MFCCGYTIRMGTRIFFGGTTSMQHLRLFAPKDRPFPSSDGPPRVSSFERRPSGAILPPAMLDRLARIKGTLHLYVGDERSRAVARRHLEQSPIVTDGVVRRVSIHVLSGELAPRSFLEVADGVYMASPQLTFLQTAADASVARLTRYGFELTGYYALDRQSAYGCEAREPLISTRELLKYLDLTKERGLAPNGMKRARVAARMAMDGSRSPRESESAILLTFPCSRGGYGVRRPDSLNRRIEPPPFMRPVVTQRYYEVDMFWSRRAGRTVRGAGTLGTGVEYDGRRSHRDVDHDKLRRDELKTLGVELFILNDAILRDVDRLDAFARRLMSALGQRYRAPRAGKYPERRLRLRHELLGEKLITGDDAPWCRALAR